MRSLGLLAYLLVLLLTGCTARQMPGFRETFVMYNVRDDQLAEITRQLQRAGLTEAVVTRDLSGRARLIGNYRTDDEVDVAFLIVQGVVGMKATSPFYPENVQQTRWAAAMAQALADAARASPPARPPLKLALVIGISQFKQSDQISTILGAEDADTAASLLQAYGYQVTLLKEQDATRNAIVSALNQLRDQIGPQDQVFIFISSHGTPPVPVGNAFPELGSDYKMSIVAYDTEVKDKRLLDRPSDIFASDQADIFHDARRRFHETSVQDLLLREVLAKRTAGTRLVLDVCYGGNLLIGTPDPYAGQRGGDGSTGEVSSIPADSLINSPSMGSGMAAKGINQAEPGQPAPSGALSTSSSLLAKNAPLRTVITAADVGEQSFGPTIIKDGGKFTHPLNPKQSFKGSYFAQMFFAELALWKGSLMPSFENSKKATLLVHQRGKQAVSIKQHPQLRTNEPADVNILK